MMLAQLGRMLLRCHAVELGGYAAALAAIEEEIAARAVDKLSEDGAKASAGNYHEGRRTGRYVRWGEGGEKEMETHYLDGSKNGPFVFWHPNGVKESEGNYTDDKMDGLFLRWTREGVPKERITYRDWLSYLDWLT